MVVHIEVGDIEVAVLQDNQDRVVLVEFSEQQSVLVVVQTVHIGVIPHLASSERGMAVALQSDACQRIFTQYVSLRDAPLDGNFGEVFQYERALAICSGIENGLDYFCLAIRIGGHIDDFRAWRALCDIVFAVAGDGRDEEALDEIRSLLAIAIDHVVDCALVVFLEHLQMHDVFPNKQLVGYTHHLVFSVLIKYNNVIDVGAVADELVAFERRSDESLLAVDVEFFVCLNHLHRLNRIEILEFRLSGMVGSVFLPDIFEPLHRHVRHVCQVAVDALHLCLHLCDGFVSLVAVELENALHLDFQQPQDIVLGHLANHLRIERCQPLVDIFAGSIDGRCVLERFAFIDALLDEYFFQ